jgi:hypothetical protein
LTTTSTVRWKKPRRSNGSFLVLFWKKEPLTFCEGR